VITYKNKEKILVIIPNLNGGGAELAITNLCNGFASLDIETTLILFNLEGPFLERVSKKVNIRNLKTKRAILSIFSIKRVIQEINPSIILTALDNATSATLLARSFARRKTLVVASVHHPLTRVYNERKSIQQRCISTFIKNIFCMADGFIAVSTIVCEDLKVFLKPHLPFVYHIPNPIISHSIKKLSLEKPLHPWFKHNNNVIISIGRLSDEKDFPTLINAFAILPKHLNSKLLILGDGPKREKIQKLIHEKKLEKNIELLGFVGNPFSFLSMAACFVLSSKFEGFGNVIVEALYCGCPVVSSNCVGGPAEILQNGKYGKLVDVGDSKGMAKAITKQLYTGKKPISNDLKKHLDQYSSLTVAKKYLSVFNEIYKKRYYENVFETN